MAGVKMSIFNRRKKTVAGCLIRTDLHSIKFYLHGVYLHNVPRCTTPGEHISIFVRFDVALNISLAAAKNLINYHRRSAVDHLFVLHNDETDDLENRYGTRP